MKFRDRYLAAMMLGTPAYAALTWVEYLSGCSVTGYAPGFMLGLAIAFTLGSLLWGFVIAALLGEKR